MPIGLARFVDPLPGVVRKRTVSKQHLRQDPHAFHDMEFDRAHADAKKLRHLGLRDAIHFPQPYHLPAFRRQHAERRAQTLHLLPGVQTPFRRKLIYQDVQIVRITGWLDGNDAVMARARRLMPGFVGLLFLSGFALFHIRCNGFSCLQPQFGWGWLLALKALLAFGVLAVFIGAVRAGRNGTMDPCRFRHTHRVVLILMIGIVVLAKLMFYA